MKTYPLNLIVLTLALSLAACGGGGPAPAAGPNTAAAPTGPAWSTLPNSSRLYYDNSGGITDSLRVVVRNVDEFRTLWTQATSRQSVPPAAPTVDFQREMLLVVGGGRRSPEDLIRVDSIAVPRNNQSMTVVVRLTEGCTRLNVAAYPVEIVKVSRVDGAVEWVERRDRPLNCAPR